MSCQARDSRRIRIADHENRSINTRYKLHVRQSDDVDDSGVNNPCTPLCTAGGCNNDGSCTIAKRGFTPLGLRDNNASGSAIAPRDLQKRVLAALTTENIADYYREVLDAAAYNETGGLVREPQHPQNYQPLVEDGYESGEFSYETAALTLFSCDV